MKIKEFRSELDKFKDTYSSQKTKFLKQVIKDSKAEHNYPVYHASSYYLALYYVHTVNINKGRKILERIRNEMVYSHYIDEYVLTLNLLGIIEQTFNGELSKYYYKQALALAKKHKNENFESLIYSNMAVAYTYEREKSIEYILKSIEKTDKNNYRRLSISYLNLCVQYKMSNQIDKAYEALDLCMNKYNGYDYNGINLDICRLDLYYCSDNMEEFKKMEDKIEKLLFTTKFEFIYFQSCQTLCVYYLKYKYYDKLLKVLDILDEFVKKNKYEEIEYFICGYRCEYCKLINDYKTMSEVLLRKNELLVQKQIELNNDVVKRVDAGIKLAKVKIKSDETKKLNKILHKQLNTDILTGLNNRQSLNLIMNNKSKKMLNSKTLTIVMIDVDNFKNINDTYGHLVGDEVLKEIGHIMNEFKSDRIEFYRFGGDEFIEILYNYEKEEVLAFAKELKERISKVDIIEKYELKITQGICIDRLKANDINTYISNADKALYIGKQNKESIVFYK